MLELNSGTANLAWFADGEVQVEIHESVLRHQYFRYSEHLPASKWELYGSSLWFSTRCDALRQMKFQRSCLIMGTQGKIVVVSRAPISAKCIADLLNSAAKPLFWSIFTPLSNSRFFRRPKRRSICYLNICKTLARINAEDNYYTLLALMPEA